MDTFHGLACNFTYKLSAFFFPFNMETQTETKCPLYNHFYS